MRYRTVKLRKTWSCCFLADALIHYCAAYLPILQADSTGNLFLTFACIVALADRLSTDTTVKLCLKLVLPFGIVATYIGVR